MTLGSTLSSNQLNQCINSFPNCLTPSKCGLENSRTGVNQQTHLRCNDAIFVEIDVIKGYFSYGSKHLPTFQLKKFRPSWAPSTVRQRKEHLLVGQGWSRLPQQTLANQKNCFTKYPKDPSRSLKIRKNPLLENGWIHFLPESQTSPGLRACPTFRFPPVAFAHHLLVPGVAILEWTQPKSE